MFFLKNFIFDNFKTFKLSSKYPKQTELLINFLINYFDNFKTFKLLLKYLKKKS
jgi:hypothetical protein